MKIAIKLSAFTVNQNIPKSYVGWGLPDLLAGFKGTSR